LSNLDRLFYWRGISNSFYNYKGEYTEVSLENRLKLLDAMGVDATSEEQIASEVFRLDIKPWLDWLPPLSICDSETPSIDFSFAPEELAQPLSWTLLSENKITLKGAVIPNSLEEVGDYHHGVVATRNEG
jgi:4-alpha-glucanotransferase